MNSPKQPKAADPAKVAQAQTESNVNTGVANTVMGNANEIGPYGSVTYNQIGSQNVGGIDVPQYERVTTLSPEQQQILALNNQFDIGSGQLANSQVNRLQGILDTPITADDLATQRADGMISAPQYEKMGVNDWSQDRQRVEDALYARVNPQLERDRSALESRLANQGIRQGSEAWREAMALADRQANDARMQTILAGGQEQSRLAGLEQSRLGFNNNAEAQNFSGQIDARNFQNATREAELAEQMRLRNQPINEITALMSGSQVQTPQASPYRPGTVPMTDVAGIQQQAYQNQMQQFQQRQAQQNSMLGGIGSLVGTIGGFALGGPMGASMGGQLGGMMGGIGR